MRVEINTTHEPDPASTVAILEWFAFDFRSVEKTGATHARRRTCTEICMTMSERLVILTLTVRFWYIGISLLWALLYSQEGQHVIDLTKPCICGTPAWPMYAWRRAPNNNYKKQKTWLDNHIAGHCVVRQRTFSGDLYKLDGVEL